MTPAALIQSAVLDGLRVTVTPDRKIKIAGKREAVERWLPVLEKRKTEVVCALSSPIPGVDDFHDDVEERAAIMEYDGGMPRAQAEAAALEDCKVIWLDRIRRQRAREAGE